MGRPHQRVAPCGKQQVYFGFDWIFKNVALLFYSTTALHVSIVCFLSISPQEGHPGTGVYADDYWEKVKRMQKMPDFMEGIFLKCADIDRECRFTVLVLGMLIVPYVHIFEAKLKPIIILPL